MDVRAPSDERGSDKRAPADDIATEVAAHYGHANLLGRLNAALAADGAYSMNVSMNVADKPALYAEIRRVLAPGGWLVLSEIAKGDGRELDYPTPWADSARASFLATPDETRAALNNVGFDVERVHGTLDAARAFGARSRARVERGEPPIHRAVMLIHGDVARAAMANSARALQDGRIVPIEVVARKRS